MPHARPTWRLPPGVSRGVWDYIHNRSIAADYDRYFADHWLFRIDERFVLEQLAQHGAQPGEWVADLGCGTGRMLLALARTGYRGLAIDLSEQMLEQVRQKAAAADLHIPTLRANLVHLEGLATGALHHAISMFSTWGMIRGREHRRQALAEVRRIVRPGGLFILHVHNYWYNLQFPGGAWWMLKNGLRTLVRRDCELGDKFYPYRGLPNMFLHVFRYREIMQDLRGAGFQQVRSTYLDPRREDRLRWPKLLGNYRAGGWFFVCS